MPAATPLNILWISLEDTSPRFGCYGDTLAQTPNIDKLAAAGRIYPNAFSTAGVCAPSRSAIITGMYQTAIGTQHMRTAHRNRSCPEMPTPYEAVIPHYAKLFPEYLRAAGYYCTNNAKTDYQFAPPITAWDQCSDQGHWRNRKEGQPFFAVFNPTFTHESGMFERDEMPELITDPDKVVVPPYLPDTPKSRIAIARQYDNLRHADAFVGDILAQLEEDGLAQDTIVMLWSDHGEGLPRGKRWPYQRGIHVPLIVRHPQVITPGDNCDDLVSMVDLGPSVLSLAGVPVPAHMQGQAFLGDQAQPPRDYVYAARDRHDEAYDMVRTVRDDRYQYVRHFHPEKPLLSWIPYRNQHPIAQELWRLEALGELQGDERLMFEYPRPPEELFDLQNDPWELKNLASDPAHAQTLDRLSNELDRWRRDVGDMGDMSEEQMVTQMYPTGEQPITAAPVFAPITTTSYARTTADEGSFAWPCLLQLHCSTQGASIAYTLDEGDNARWELYTQPIRLSKGHITVRAKAIRIGYRESPQSEGKFEITG